MRDLLGVCLQTLQTPRGSSRSTRSRLADGSVTIPATHSTQAPSRRDGYRPFCTIKDADKRRQLTATLKRAHMKTRAYAFKFKMEGNSTPRWAQTQTAGRLCSKLNT